MSPFEHGEVFVLDDGGEVRVFEARRSSGLHGTPKGLCRQEGGYADV